MKTRMKHKVLAKRWDDCPAQERLRSLLLQTEQELQEYENSTLFPLSTSAAITRQIERLRKRAALGADGLDEVAIANFKEVNEVCGKIVPEIDPFVLDNARDFIRRAFERFTSANSGSVQEVLDLGLLIQLWRYGPGASRGTMATHFADKIRCENPTVTRAALPYADLLRKCNPHLFAFDGKISCEFRIVPGSVLNTVPKNEETERTIATEPLMNMALQLAAGAYIEGALRSMGVDIKDQQFKNKQLAEIASILDHLATVDLKNASDLICLALIKLLYPTEWYELIVAIRSPVTRIGKKDVTLNMVSTMGNGFTFPLMTLTLLALIYGVQSNHDNAKHYLVDYSTTAVFGDDIIVPVCDYGCLCDTLSAAGLVVNEAKSYAEGPFRESCGGDYWLGYDITPFYIESIQSDPEIYVAINKIHKWSMKTGIYLDRTITMLLSYLDSKSPFLVPEWYSPDQGVLSNQVPARFRFWEPERPLKRILVRQKEIDILLLMITGGYVQSCADPNASKKLERADREFRKKTGQKDLTNPRGSGVEVVQFTRRLPKKFVPATLYSLHEARLPKGYLDGHDYLLGNHDAGNWRDIRFTLCSLDHAEIVDREPS